jgi:hypothetical protein
LFGARPLVGPIPRATRLVAALPRAPAAVCWAIAVHVVGEGMTPEVTARVVSRAGGALLANVVSLVILIVETVMLRR